MMITLAGKYYSDSNYKSISKTPEPFIFQALWCLYNPNNYFNSMQKRYGDMYIIPKFFGFPERLVISNPQAIQQIFTTDSSLFTSDSQFRPLVGENSVMLQNGERHVRQRKLLMPPFHGERMRSYGEQTRKITKQVMDKVNPGETFVARSVTQEISLNIILKIIFGISEGEKYQKIQKLITNLSHYSKKADFPA